MQASCNELGARPEGRRVIGSYIGSQAEQHREDGMEYTNCELSSEYSEESGLHVIVPGIRPIVDIIAVHGLAADPVYTWVKKVLVSEVPNSTNLGRVNKKGEMEVVWLKHLLPKVVPNARILKFNYNSKYLMEAPKENLRSIATRLVQEINSLRVKYSNTRNRPIIFVGHSFGGIVIKEALLVAFRDTTKTLQHIAYSAHGVIFLGTPHRGSKASSLGKKITYGASVLGFEPHSQLIQTLEKGSDQLKALMEDFLDMARKVKINLVCFYELHQTQLGKPFGPKIMVVEEESATIDGHPRISIPLDHSQLNKFGSLKDEGFELVSSKLLELVQASQSLLPQQVKDLRKARLWLGALEEDFEYKKNIKLHTSGTCAWVFEHPDFKAWMNSQESILLISGIMGSGKSVLQSFIVRELGHQAHNHRNLVLYFFFKNDSPLAMVATLIEQWIQQYRTPQFANLLIEAMHKSNSERCGSLDQLWTLFLNLVDAYVGTGPVSIIVDGLDECVDRNLLSEILERIKMGGGKYNWREVEVRFLLSSRLEDDIIKVLTSSDTAHSTLRINLESKFINPDIIRFLEDKILTESKKLGRFKDKIIQILPRKSQGMFRYAALMLEQLVEPSRDVERTLNSIPPGLNNMYVWILKHLSNKEYDLGLRKTVFTWVAMSFRPVSVKEVALAYAAYDPEDSDPEDSEDHFDFDPAKAQLADTHHILRACGSFIEVIESQLENTDILSFSHSSVKDFVLMYKLKKRNQDAFLKKFEGHGAMGCLISDPNIAHRNILRACINQLLSSNFIPKAPDTELHIYSVTHWLYHARYIQNDVMFIPEAKDTDVQKLMDSDWQAICKFLSESNPSFTSWLDKFPSYELSAQDTCLYKSSSNWRMVTPLHIMASFGLWIPLLATTNDSTVHPDLECEDKNKGWTPLTWAASCGHDNMVKLLLEKDADIYANKGDIGTDSAMTQAILRGHSKIITLLVNGFSLSMGKLRRIISLNKATWLDNPMATNIMQVLSKDDHGGIILLTAAKYGLLEVVKLLLEEGAEKEYRDNMGFTPLLWATMFSHLETVKLLLEKGAEIRCRDDDGNTSLSFAARFGYLEIAKLLLEKGAEIECRDNKRYTPLIYAATLGHLEIVKLLLEKGAEIECKDRGKTTPLIRAAGFNHFEIVGLLLGKGAEIECRDCRGFTPLIWATILAHPETVEVLLQNGAEIECRDDEGNTPLVLAASLGHLEVVKLLLEKGAETECKHKGKFTPLMLAAAFGHLEIVRLLLEKGAEIADKEGNPSLILAAGLGSLELVGVVIKCRANHDNPPLKLTTKKTRQEIVQLILQKIAETEYKKFDGDTPLSLAIRSGDFETALMAIGSNSKAVEDRA